MSGSDSAPRKAQLDKAEREHLEDVVTDIRELVEREIEYELEHQYELTSREGGGGLSDEEQAVREELVAAIEHEDPGEKSWQWCYEQYVNGVGYTFINRLAALRCMEVRGFIQQPVTQIGESGLTPAAEQVLGERFDVGPDEALIAAFEDACERFDDEIELLFDTNSPYTVFDINPDLFEEATEKLDEVPEAVWRADDVLGWVYEYYNLNLLDDLRRKGDREGLEPEDVPPANQFYTPHWVVRMLTDNSLGKLYLEHTGELQDVVDDQESFAPEERKNRPLSPDESPDIADFCTYLVPSEEAGEPTDFDHPRELQVIDPACGSGHFLLYAFDVLERIWRAETDLPTEQIPRKILQHNLYGVDLDMRACQLAAFNLYLKGRTRAEAEGADGFDMPEVGIVCADASIAEIDGVEAVFDEVAGDDPEVQQALERILDAFEEVHGLGSLLDVRGTLGDLFEDDADIGGTQLTLGDDPRESHTLSQVLHSLREAVEEHRESDSFLAQDLRSFVRLLDILAQDYDVALMNPPYGSRGRMPSRVQEYVEDHYRYTAEFYINFFEVCDRLSKRRGRIGMLVPRTFMFKGRFTDFRTDFIGDAGSFDFLSEFGIGILDNATVRTVGTVVRSNVDQKPKGTFLRLHDVEAGQKEPVFGEILSGSTDDVTRLFQIGMDEFQQIPRHPICYSIPKEVRDLNDTELKLDAKQAGVEGMSASKAVPGLLTANDERFARFYWEVSGDDLFEPLSKGGESAWVMPQIKETVEWGEDGTVMKRSSPAVRTPNEELYGEEGLTWTYIKETGRRFGYYAGGLFNNAGFMMFPKGERSPWNMMAVLNSDLYHNLFLSQTPDRHWNAGELGAVPWLSELDDVEQLNELAKDQYQLVVQERFHDPVSPYYIGSEILPSDIEFFYDHPHTEYAKDEFNLTDYESIDQETAIPEAARTQEVRRLNHQRQLEELSDGINDLIYSELGISEGAQEDVLKEVFLRTSESPEDRKIPDPESVPEIPENIDKQVKDLVHHFAMEAVREEDDGIIPLHGVDDQPNMLDRIVERFEDAYGEHAEDRLVEVDEILGAESAAEEAYPNLRRWIAEDLFEYHVSRMENTPIVWKLTTDRLVADVAETGFACFVDYHQLDSDLFDRLTTQYLDPRKVELRNRQSTANQRRNNEALSPTEHSEAAETFEQMTNMLDQIAELESVLQDLGSVTEREFSQERREQVEALAPKVAAFRMETKKRLDALTELREEKGQNWFQDTFSDGFWEKVQEWDDEWLDALDELEHACEAYAKPNDEPVEAHLADLFDYFNWRLKGSDHYSSSGILFMTYYFEREGSELLDENGDPYEHLSDDEKLLAELATGLNDTSVLDEEYIAEVWDGEEEPPALAEYKTLADEIDDRCQAVNREIPSDWADRALSEITTAGYQPNPKHGVAINITPLAEQNIVPKTVDDDVL
ncbi:BREX-5 system adenine-specific DNA-methyltransferase PglX [Haloarchaeobius sp. FL176]|uniref:BREX-5 system adenine-specific DNA-methyltransferase PglX n=1 Tax=Haloarchaeobius sp. FL176 TaxID=2967129 RepID=UPI0021484895